MDNALTITQGALDFTRPELVKTLKATVAQGLTEPEFYLFVEHCKATQLNPFKKEVWAIKAGGRLQVMTGINGFLTIANKHPMFDGMEIIVDSDEKPTKAICKVYRKDRKYPSEGIALIKEYGKDTPIWKQMPRVMLTKVAKSIALREAFPQELSGLYTQEEMPVEFAAPTREIPVTKTVEPEVEFAEVVNEETSETYYYKLYPNMDGFDVWKAKVKALKGRFNGETKLWQVSEAIPGLESQLTDANGNFINKRASTKTKKSEQTVELDVPDMPESPPHDDDDLPF